MHSQLATEQPAGLSDWYWLKRPAVPPCAWSSPVMTTTAFSPRGRYQKRGIGLRSRAIVVTRFASKRCCSSACGMCILLRSIQSGWTSPAIAPKKRSFVRIGKTPSRSCPAHAGLPWRVRTTERERSYVNAAAWPPLDPTERSVTAGFVVEVVALE